MTELRKGATDGAVAVQDDIARSVVKKLRPRLLGGTDPPLVERPTKSLDAYRCYLRGRHYQLSRYDAERASQVFRGGSAARPSLRSSLGRPRSHGRQLGVSHVAAAGGGVRQGEGGSRACADAR